MDNKMTNDLHVACLNGISTRGDDEALKTLYDMLHKKVYFFLFRILGEKEAAEDIMVETFTVIWKSAGSYSGRSSVSTWILGIARNLALDELRKRKFHDCVDDHPHIAGGEIPSMEQADRSRVIRVALDRLSPKHQEVIDLVYFHELNYPEVSELLGIPVGTVKTRIFHAKNAIRAALASLKVGQNDL